MKQVTAIPVLALMMLAVGCGQKQQVKVTFLSDPPGGLLYTHGGDLKGTCPMALWYDVDQKATERGYLNAEGMEVRWPSGPAKRSKGQIRITVNGTDRHVVFLQPNDEPGAFAEVPSSPPSETSDAVHAELTDATRIQNADAPNIERGETAQVAEKTPASENMATYERVPASVNPPTPEKTVSPAKQIVSEATSPAYKPTTSDRTVSPEKPVAAEPTPASSPKKPAVPDNASERKPPERVLTLSEEQLVLLDWHSSNRTGARVESSGPTGGPGVEFNIYFPNNTPGNCSLSFVSSGGGGRGTLVGADVSDYDAYALKLTLVSINGKKTVERKQELVAGAVIGPTPEGRLTGYQPFKLSLAAPERTVTVKTPVATDKIYEIGFHIHAVKYDQWSPSGSRIVLRVEPAGDERAWASDSSKH